MDERKRPRLLGTLWQWGALALCGALGLALFTLVDLAPKVQPDFFFSTDDLQFQQSLRIEREFTYAPQVFVVAKAKTLVSGQYLLQVHKLTQDLQKIDGVVDVRSLTNGPKEAEEVFEEVSEGDIGEIFEDLEESPFWTALLLAPDRSATFLAI